MFPLLLQVHIFGAILTFGLCAVGFLFPEKRIINKLNLLTLFEVTSGSYLSVLVSDSPLQYCTKLGLYLFAIAATQFYLIHKTNTDWKLATSFTGIGSLAIFIVTALTLSK